LDALCPRLHAFAHSSDFGEGLLQKILFDSELPDLGVKLLDVRFILCWLFWALPENPATICSLACFSHWEI